MIQEQLYWAQHCVQNKNTYSVHKALIAYLTPGGNVMFIIVLLNIFFQNNTNRYKLVVFPPNIPIITFLNILCIFVHALFFFLEMLQNKANLQTTIQLVVFTSWWHSKTALLRRTERQK